jgi:hypothetical protein
MKLLALTCLCVDVYSRTGKVYSGGNALNVAAFITSYFMNGNIKASMEKGSEAAVEILTHFGGI